MHYKSNSPTSLVTGACITRSNSSTSLVTGACITRSNSPTSIVTGACITRTFKIFSQKNCRQMYFRCREETCRAQVSGQVSKVWRVSTRSTALIMEFDARRVQKYRNILYNGFIYGRLPLV